MAEPSENWKAILEEGEKITWQGRPEQGIHLGLGDIAMIAFALFFTGFSVFWMAMAMRAGGFFWMFGLLHFSAGLGLLINAIFGNAFIRRHSFYTLTDRRAFIGKELPVLGRSLNSWRIGPASPLELVHLPDGSGTINFARSPSPWYSRNRGDRGVSFERIKDATKVFSMMSHMQKGQA